MQRGRGTNRGFFRALLVRRRKLPNWEAIRPLLRCKVPLAGCVAKRTATRFHSKAQRRAAHAGYRVTPSVNPNGVQQIRCWPPKSSQQMNVVLDSADLD